MLIILESRNFSLLEEAMEQLKSNFIQCNPVGVVSENSNLDLGKLKNKGVTLVALGEPYRLIDCMNSNSKPSKEFVYQTIDYLHQENHHLAISLHDFSIMNRRLKTLVNSRVRLRTTRFQVISLTNGRHKTGILGKDNLWEIITAPPETLPEENLEPEENPENKVLVTIMSKSGREDCLVEPEEPFTMKDGKVLTVTLPDTPDVML